MKKKINEELFWVVPKQLDLPGDPLRLRVNFYADTIVVTSFSPNSDKITTKVVSAMDLSHAITRELSFSTGLLPENTLWWNNTSDGPEYAIYTEPKIRILSIQFVNKPVMRYKIPVPPCIFICKRSQAPYVFAVKRKPLTAKDTIYYAPFPNMSENGRSCGGTNSYPDDVSKIPDMFWVSFFTSHGQLENRSKKYPKNLLRLWEALNTIDHVSSVNPDEYPLSDLVKCGTIETIMNGHKLI